MNERGMTVVELVAGTALFLVLFAGLGAALSTDRGTERVLTAQVSSELTGQRALHRIASELRLASVVGEDRDRNGLLDAGEDTNLDGQLDADWSLEDGATDEASIVFNLRVDEYDNAGNQTASGVVSGPITYRVVDGRLERERLFGAQTQRSVIARGITGLRFSRAGRVVTVSLDVRVRRGDYADGTRTLSTRVRVVN